MRLQFDEMFKDWDCSTCTAELREFRGHDGPPAQGDYLIDIFPGRAPERFDRCPLLAITRETAGWLTLYGDYERGILPWPGALYQQPMRWYHAMKVIAAAVARCEREQYEEAAAQGGGNTARGSHGRSTHWDNWARGG